MRNILALAVTALWMSTALADEPAACYAAQDPTQQLSMDKLASLKDDPALAAEFAVMLKQSSRAILKCEEAQRKREGSFLNHAAVLYGARISPNGKITQVAVMASEGVNDAMLKACIGRIVCQWEVGANPDGQERLVAVPPFVWDEHVAERRSNREWH